jgi:hypothetical protein
MKYVLRYVEFVPSPSSRRSRKNLRFGKNTKPMAVTFHTDPEAVEVKASLLWSDLSRDRHGTKRDIEFRSLEQVSEVHWKPSAE